LHLLLTEMVNINTGATQESTIPSSCEHDSNTITIGTSSPIPDTGNSGTIQVVVAQLVHEDQSGSADVVPPNALQQCLPDTHTFAGRWLCFGIVALLVLGALGAVALGILCGSGLCSPSKENDPPITSMPILVQSSFSPTTTLPTTQYTSSAVPSTNKTPPQMPIGLPTASPSTQALTSEAPATKEPTTLTPTLPSTRNPTTNVPTTKEPVTQRPPSMPTERPSTQNGTSAMPTTNRPSIPNPTAAPPSGLVTIFGTCLV
jgi:hypothetical protein